MKRNYMGFFLINPKGKERKLHTIKHMKRTIAEVATWPRYVSKWWKDIMTLDKGGGGSWFNTEVCRRLKSGLTTSFWNTRWRGGTTLSAKYLRLFTISNQKEAKVAEMGRDRGNESGWNFIWRRRLFVWEEELLNRLLIDLQGFELSQGEDEWRWRLEDGGGFTVRSIYKKLERAAMGEEGWGEEENKVFSQIWKSGAPSRVVAFCSKGLLNRIPTRVNLAWRNVLPVNVNSNCVFCNEREESTNHLFLHCNVTWKIWLALHQWLEVNLIIPANLFSHWRCWDGLMSNRKESKRGMRIIWHTALWVIWNYRNNIIFNNGGIEVEDVVDEIKMLSWKWCLARLRIHPCLYYEWRWDPRWCMGHLRS
jgi:hypothetical protein